MGWMLDNCFRAEIVQQKIDDSLAVQKQTAHDAAAIYNTLNFARASKKIPRMNACIA